MSSTHSAQIYDVATFAADDPSLKRAGIFLAWAVNHQLISESLSRDGAANVTKVRLRAIRGSELLTTVCSGELKAMHLSDQGNDFAAAYYDASYRDAFSSALKEHDERVTSVQDDLMSEWALYDQLAPGITRAYRDRYAPPSQPPNQLNVGAAAKPKSRPSWLKIVK